MADTKISALTAVTTPALTDEFAVNQGGTSKKATLSQVIASGVPVINVKNYGAVGDDSTDNTTAFANAVAAASSGSIVYVPAGIYRLSQVDLTTNGVTLMGAGIGSVLKMTGTANDTVDLGLALIRVTGDDVTVCNLKVLGRGGGTTDDMGIGMQDCVRTTIRDVTVADIGGRAVFLYGTTNGADGCTDGLYENLTILNTLQRTSGTAYGVPLWGFIGARRNRFVNLYIDGCDNGAIMLDAATSGGSTVASCDRNVFVGLTILNACRVQGVAINVAGGKYNQFTDFLIDVNDNPGFGITILRDQSGTESLHNVFDGGSIRNCDYSGILLQSARLNVFRNIEMQDVGQAAANHCPIYVGWTEYDGPTSGGPSSDNLFSDIVVTECNVTTYYDYFVLFNIDDADMLRNHFRNCRYVVAPAVGLIGTVGAGFSAPLTGTDANTFDNRNGGSASIATGGTIAHGLKQTPTKYGCQSTSSAGAYVSAVSATNLTITFTGGGSQTIVWWAEV